jgi:hypothetical protein
MRTETETETEIEHVYYRSRHDETRSLWLSLSREPTPVEQYCAALSAYFGNAINADHSNEFAATQLIASAEQGYLTAVGPLSLYFDWYLEKERPDKLALISPRAINNLLAVDDLDCAYWSARFTLSGNCVRKNVKRGLEMLRKVSVPARPSYCREFAEVLERQRARALRGSCAHYYYFAASLGDVFAARQIGQDLLTGSDVFPCEPTLSRYWLELGRRGQPGRLG